MDGALMQGAEWQRAGEARTNMAQGRGKLAVPVTDRPRLLTPETVTERKARAFPEDQRKSQHSFKPRLISCELVTTEPVK